MGYFPNRMAIGLRSNATRTIGMVLNDLENPTRSYIIKKISTEMIMVEEKKALDVEEFDVMNDSNELSIVTTAIDYKTNVNKFLQASPSIWKSR